MKKKWSLKRIKRIKVGFIIGHVTAGAMIWVCLIMIAVFSYTPYQRIAELVFMIVGVSCIILIGISSHVSTIVNQKKKELELEGVSIT